MQEILIQADPPKIQFQGNSTYRNTQELLFKAPAAGVKAVA